MGNPLDEAFTGKVPIRILPLKPGEKFFVWFVGSIRGWLTHWDGERTEMCRGDGRCPRSLHMRDAIWKGYAPVLWSERMDGSFKPAVAEITEAMEHSLRGYVLSSSIWMFARSPQKKDSVAKLTWLMEMEHGKGLPAPFSIEPTLKRIYRISEFPPEESNPVPFPDLAETVQLGDATAQRLRELLHELTPTPQPAEAPDPAAVKQKLHEEMKKRGMKSSSNGRD